MKNRTTLPGCQAATAAAPGEAIAAPLGKVPGPPLLVVATVVVVAVAAAPPEPRRPAASAVHASGSTTGTSPPPPEANLGTNPAPTSLTASAAATRRATEIAVAAPEAGCAETGEVPGAMLAAEGSGTRWRDGETAALRAGPRRPSALAAPTESEALAASEPDSSAHAVGIDAIAPPTPNATASAPTRPT